ncbi:MAG: hypothetical protein MUC61_00355 [Amoebophilaceae bacterium]|jgi:chromosome segregation ATPase|nr:hypothetical protein [Amoebophilaceae bacterium]
MFRDAKIGVVCLLLFVHCSNAELSERIEELEKQTSLASEQRERELEQLQRQVNGFDTQLTQTKEQVENVDADLVKKLERQVSLANEQRERELEQLRRQVNGFDTQLTQTKEQVESVNANRIEELEKLEQLQRQVNGFDTQLTQTKERVENVDADLVKELETQASLANEQREKDLEPLRKQVSGLDTLLSKTKKRVESVDADLEDTMKDIRCLSSALREFHNCLFIFVEGMDFDRFILSDENKSVEDNKKEKKTKRDGLLVSCSVVKNICDIVNPVEPSVKGVVPEAITCTLSPVDSESLGNGSFLNE